VFFEASPTLTYSLLVLHLSFLILEACIDRLHAFVWLQSLNLAVMWWLQYARRGKKVARQPDAAGAARITDMEARAQEQEEPDKI
jgi:hypothetical protein